MLAGFLDDHCISDGGIWCSATDPANQGMLVAMGICLLAAIFLLARIVMRAMRSFSESRKQDVPSIATKLKERRQREDSAE
jgi:hypothetical protein